MRCLVTGGGTGGHIYPAMAVAEAVIRLLPNAKVLYVGTSTGMESNLVPKEGFDFESIRSLGIMGKSPIAALKGIWAASLGLNDARKIIKRFRPDVVLGTGGYVSGPMVLASYLMGIPCAIQEQNAIPGKTNLILSRITKITFTAWEQTIGLFPKNANVKVTGNPIRANILNSSIGDAKSQYGLSNQFTLLVLGGSRGARFLVDIAIDIAKAGNVNTQMILITGQEYFGRAVARLNAKVEVGIDGAKCGNIILRPYIYEMETAYRACEMVLARAGGMTLAEITALGLPSIIVPSPNVVGNHQEYNARELEAVGAALIVPEGENTFESVEQGLINILLNPERYKKMAQASRNIGRPNAAKQIALELISLAKRG